MFYGIIICLVFAIDQISKVAISYFIEYGTGSYVAIVEDFIHFVHVRNPVMLFGMGRGLSTFWRFCLTIIAPISLLIGLFIYLVFNRDFTNFQRNCVAVIIGGGFGNLFDRIFRTGGVVDFVDVRVFGLFGLEWWPTFNVADMTIVIFGLLFLVSNFVPRRNADAKAVRE